MIPAALPRPDFNIHRDIPLDGAIGLYGRDERSLCRYFGVNPMPLNIALQKLP